MQGCVPRRRWGGETRAWEAGGGLVWPLQRARGAEGNKEGQTECVCMHLRTRVCTHPQDTTWSPHAIDCLSNPLKSQIPPVHLPAWCLFQKLPSPGSSPRHSGRMNRARMSAPQRAGGTGKGDENWLTPITSHLSFIPGMSTEVNSGTPGWLSS